MDLFLSWDLSWFHHWPRPSTLPALFRIRPRMGLGSLLISGVTSHMLGLRRVSGKMKNGKSKNSPMFMHACTCTYTMYMYIWCAKDLLNTCKWLLYSPTCSTVAVVHVHCTGFTCEPHQPLAHCCLLSLLFVPPTHHHKSLRKPE